MNKYLSEGGILLLAGVFVLGMFLGLNWTMKIYSYENIWPEERGGLQKLNKMLKDDNSERLAVIVITQKQQAIISSLDDSVEIKAGIFEKRNP